MRVFTLGHLRHETRFVIHIATRDLMKHLATATMVLAVCWYAGWRGPVLIIAGSIIFSEIVARIITRIAPEREDEISLGLMGVMWINNIGSAMLYLLPSVLLASQPSVALLLAGFMWLFGVYVHISNTFVALPFYNWSQMIPAFGTAFGVFYVSSTTTFHPAPMIDWAIASLFMVVYIVNTFETLLYQKDTQRALDVARDEVQERLRDMEHLSRHDGLTGLLNRRAFDKELERMLAVKRRSAVAVLLLDLDGFKPINDTYSHDAGDRVLVEVAARLHGLAGEYGVAARLGGDEFVLAAPGIGSDQEAMRIARQLAAAIEVPIAYHDKVLKVSASIGIGSTAHTGATVEDLCVAADQAMFRAKAETGDRCVLYVASDFPPRPTLEDRAILFRAIKSGEIRPFYQPKVWFDDSTTCGFEALARWVHPTRGVLSPAHFLPQINEFGLHGDLLNQIAEQVMRDVEGMLHDRLDPGQVSINIPEMALATQTGRQDLHRLLAKHPSVRSHITFEITEDVFIARAGDMIQDSISHFRKAGLRISLDDFGTGFASFQHLRQLEFDELKIDTGFVAGLGVDPTSDVLIAGLLDIGAGLGVSIVAEGVETQAQLDQLRAMGCKIGQGYLFGKAMPLDETRIRLFSEQGTVGWEQQVFGT
jgi:diguanylate cyclase (GGDEF)-like protein